MTTTEPKIKAPVDPSNPRYYLDKQEMNRALYAYKYECIEAEKAGRDRPQISRYLGDCFLSIARGLAMKHNFRNYSFVNDMISDGVMTCVRYIRSYDPERVNPATGAPTSALAYFTQCCHWAFVGRITTEEKQSRVKRALVYSAGADTFTLAGEDSADEFQVKMNEFLQGIGEEEVKDMIGTKKKRREPKGPLEDYLE